MSLKNKMHEKFPLIFILKIILICTISLANRNNLLSKDTNNDKTKITFKGIVSTKESDSEINTIPILLANVKILNLKLQTKTDKNGLFQFDLSNVKEDILIINIAAIGYKTLNDTILINQIENLKSNKIIEKNYELQQIYLQTGDVVVSANRSEIPIYETPIIVNSISKKTFEISQSNNIAEGISFSPGLRIENNCQNCGFTQVRMNGLDGPYSQILINSRPMYSALMGVYGLEMLPTSIIDKIEITRGGGSALFGASAIAGTINIITKDPVENTFETSFQRSFIDNTTPENIVNFNGSIISEDKEQGFIFYGSHRDRKPFDVNKDSYSELTKINNNVFGFDAFYNFDDLNRLTLNSYYINEERRGGNDFEVLPHQADIAEYLKHNILGYSVSFNHYNKDLTQKLNLWISEQYINRDSYYGGGGRVLGFNDTITTDDIMAINSYGQTTDRNLNLGLQYEYMEIENLNYTAGLEFTNTKVNDQIIGYRRKINQELSNIGLYNQFDWRVSESVKLLAGGRLDYITLDGSYDFFDYNITNKTDFIQFNPRVAALYTINNDENNELFYRVSVARGFRTPQAFDEDLHLATVGGAARATILDSNLRAETSLNITNSINYVYLTTEHQFNIVLDGFYSRLYDAFILSNQIELENGVSVITKRNGSGAIVQGLNLEFNYAFKKDLLLQSSLTFQSAKYIEKEVIWESETYNLDSTIFTENILRTPNLYGFLSMAYQYSENIELSLSAVFTGSMTVAHVIDPNNEYTVLKSTPTFWEFNPKIKYNIFRGEHNFLDISIGIYNMFNSFQKDFDFGQNRDAGYIYGPIRPRTTYLNLKFGLI